MAEMVLTSEHVRAARALLRWEQQTLAEKSGVSLPSIKRLETKPGPLGAYESTVAAIQAAFEKAGIEFANGGAPGVRLRKAARDSAGESAAARTPPSAPSKKSRPRTPAGRRKGR
jgi:transcriptional regulator with XRE-family HTH domain